MSDFDVVAVDLQICAHALEGVVEEGRTDLARITAQVEELTGARWRGQASSVYARGFDEWRAAASAGLSELTAIAERLQASGLAYTGTDQYGSGALRSAGGAV